MKKILIAIAFLTANVGFSKTLLLNCKVYKPCSQFDILRYCPLSFQVFKASGNKLEMYGRVQYAPKKGDNVPVRPFHLPAYLSDGHKFHKSGKTTRLQAGWDGYEHHFTLYSNNGRSWGGRFTLEQDTNFRVQCKKGVSP